MRAPMKSLTQNINPGPSLALWTFASMHAATGAAAPRGCGQLMR